MSSPGYQLYVGIDIAAASAMVAWTGPQAPNPSPSPKPLLAMPLCSSACAPPGFPLSRRSS